LQIQTIREMRKKLVVLTGAGISAESGLRTFREMGGLWEEYDVTEVASPEGWGKNMELVLRFYNERRRQLRNALPNDGHKGLFRLEEYFDVSIITQNVDDLHERAGSSKILHLHGELNKAQSTADKELIYDITDKDLNLGDLCEKGSQLRPYIVWFGEPVPAIEEAINICSTANFLAIIGTSMNVYPAAGLIDYIPPRTKVFIIDPNKISVQSSKNIVHIKEKASKGVQILTEYLLNEM